MLRLLSITVAIPTMQTLWSTSLPESASFAYREASKSEMLISVDLLEKFETPVAELVPTLMILISSIVFPYFVLNNVLAELTRARSVVEPSILMMPLYDVGVVTLFLEDAVFVFDGILVAVAKLEATVETVIPNCELEADDELPAELIFGFGFEQPENIPIIRTLAIIIEVVFFNKFHSFLKA